MSAELPIYKGDYWKTFELPVEVGAPLVVGRPFIIGSDLGPLGNDNGGPLFRFTNDTLLDGIVWNGHGAPYRATGGVIRRVKLVKDSPVDGGAALSIVAQNGELRPGEGIIDELRVFCARDLENAKNAGRWQDGVVIDGQACREQGAAGVRQIIAHNWRIASCTGQGDFVRLDNAVHFKGSDIQCDPGRIDANRRAVFRIRDGQNIQISKLVCYGDVIIEGSAKCVVLSDIIADTVRVASTARAVTLSGVINNLIVESGATGRCDAFVVNKPSVRSWLFSVR